MAPVAVVANTDITHLDISDRRIFYRYRECLHAVGSRDDATVAVGLLDEIVAPFDETFIVTVQFLIPLHGSEICGR